MKGTRWHVWCVFIYFFILYWNWWSRGLQRERLYLCLKCATAHHISHTRLPPVPPLHSTVYGSSHNGALLISFWDSLFSVMMGTHQALGSWWKFEMPQDINDCEWRWSLFPSLFLCQKSYGVCTFNLFLSFLSTSFISRFTKFHRETDKWDPPNPRGGRSPDNRGYSTNVQCLLKECAQMYLYI